MDGEKIKALMQDCSWDLSLGVPGGVYKSDVPLFKTLMTNYCNHECAYCANSKCPKKYSYEPKELASLFLNIASAGQAGGLFLSSGIAGEADSVMEKMVESVALIRQAGFTGYVHLKALPGSSKDMICRAAEVADRLSVNMEAPSQSYLDELGTGKDFENIKKIQNWISEARPKAGQTTQFVVGAAGESDLEILEATDEAYLKRGVFRAYFSSFVPQKRTALKDKVASPKERVRRLYNVDFMLRKYKIPLKEFKEVMSDGNLPPGDPKVSLALNRFDRPLEIDEADFEELIRVPGISPRAAYVLEALKGMDLKLSKKKQLEAAGVSLKRASPFIKIDGRAQSRLKEFE